MQYGKYKFFCRFKSNAELPFYKGSTFRGVFGRALKNVVCTLKHNECNTCLLRTHCIYALVFETKVAVPVSQNSRLSATPHPFVIEPPLTSQKQYQIDDPFDFNLLLFGNMNKNLPYFIYALDQMGKIGIGKKINKNRGRFELLKVTNRGDTIYTASDQKLINQNINSLNLSVTDAIVKDNIVINFLLETPLRLKFKNKFKAELPFHVLTRAMLRRVSSLFEYYGAGEPDIDYQGLVKKAENIQIMETNLKWFDWKRYSSRQNEKMLMGGLIGNIKYKGKISNYIPIIDICNKVHIGKQTAFGLGKITSKVMT